MFILETLNNFFLYYNYNSTITNLHTSSNILNYLPLHVFYTIIFFLQTVLVSLVNSLDFLMDIQLSTNMKDAICIAVKFLLCIALLIFARGGIPRFRFDYLTKLGWIRFLSLVLLSFLVELVILSMF